MTLRIEFSLKIFEPVHYPSGSHPYTTIFYPMLFSLKVIDKRSKKTDGGRFHRSHRCNFGDRGANDIFLQSVKLCQKETKFNEKYAFTLGQI